MAIQPVVRYMILCEDWGVDPNNARRVMILGLISNIQAIDDPPYPLLYQEMCVFLALTDGYGQGEGKIICVHEGSGQKAFETRSRPIIFGPDPLEVVGSCLPYPRLRVSSTRPLPGAILVRGSGRRGETVEAEVTHGEP
jgi:hypothetical protein